MSYFDFIKEISFTRVSGTIEENKACNIIYNEAIRLGLDTSLMSFPVNTFFRGETYLKINNQSYEGIALGNSMNTNDLEIEGEIIYLESFLYAKMVNIENKICLIPNRNIDFKYYMYLINNKAKALVFTSGSIYDDSLSIDDIDVYSFKERFYQYGNIPAICIKTFDFNNIIKELPCNGKLKSSISNEVRSSYNIISEIKGSSNSSEIVVISAHYDSVKNSKGSYDNASGTAALFEISKYFLNNTPKRTIKLIWCGSEEAGLLGSKAYLKENENELYKYILNINIDMIGPTIGKNMAFIMGEDSLASFIEYYSKIEGYPLQVYKSIFKSDSIMFADKEIPSISFTRLTNENGLEIHSRRDTYEFLDEKTFINNVNFIIKFTDYITNSILFPINKSIPNNLKEELDLFIGRKRK